MALQIRRGLEADRSSITPLEGELIYTTDTKLIYVGDSTTAGGILVNGDVVDDTSPQLGGNLDLNGNNITGTGNININGTITATGNINLGDAAGDNINVAGSITTNLIPATDSVVDIGSSVLRWRDGYFAGLTVDGQIDAVSINARVIANDSTISFDPASGVFNGTFVGGLTGSVVGNTTGTHFGNVVGALTGDVKGSVFADDSTVLVDAVSGTITGSVTGDINTNNVIRVNGVAGALIAAGQNILQADGFMDPGSGRNSGVGMNIRAARNDGAGNPIVVQPGDALLDIVASGWDGNSWKSAMAIKFAVDKNVTVSDEIIPGRIIFAAYDNTGNFGVNSIMVFTSEGKLSVGAGDAPQEKLHVQGNGLFAGNVKAASFNGSLVNDDSTTFIDAIDGSVTARSFVQFGSLTTSERNALAATNGMVIYNETDNKFQGFENGSWVNLV
jgi:hypothetical protein